MFYWFRGSPLYRQYYCCRGYQSGSVTGLGGYPNMQYYCCTTHQTASFTGSGVTPIGSNIFVQAIRQGLLVRESTIYAVLLCITGPGGHSYTQYYCCTTHHKGCVTGPEGHPYRCHPYMQYYCCTAHRTGCVTGPAGHSCMQYYCCTGYQKMCYWSRGSSMCAMGDLYVSYVFIT